MHLSTYLTKIDGIVCFWTMKSEIIEELNDILARALVGALALGYHIDVIEHAEYPGARSVYGAYDSPTATGNVLQQRYALGTCGIIESTET